MTVDIVSYLEWKGQEVDHSAGLRMSSVGADSSQERLMRSLVLQILSNGQGKVLKTDFSSVEDSRESGTRIEVEVETKCEFQVECKVEVMRVKVFNQTELRLVK